MKSYRKELWFEVPARRAFINITPKVVTHVDPGGYIGTWYKIARRLLDAEYEVRIKDYLL